MAFSCTRRWAAGVALSPLTTASKDRAMLRAESKAPSSEARMVAA